MSAPGVVDQAIAAFVLHVVWQLPLLASAAWMAVRIGRPSVRVAHALWIGTLLLCVSVPMMATWQGYRTARVQAEGAAVTVNYSTADTVQPVSAMERDSAWMRMWHRHFTWTDGVKPFAFALPPRVARGIALGYLVLLAMACFRFAVALRRGRVLVRNAKGEIPQNFVVAMQEQCAAMACPVPHVALSEEIAGPLLAGVMRPTLLLPRTAAAMSAEEVEAVLAHELSHLRRRDPLCHAACSAMLLPLRFHPVTKWIALRIGQTREMACDADAVRHMGSASRYADALLCVAERMTSAPVWPAGIGLGLFDVASAASVRDGQSLLSPRSATAGLELFGARGAMEERMQSMMKDGRASGNTRLMRGLAGAAIAATGVAAACMIQVQPALAAQQKDATVQAHAVVTVDDRGPALASGHHVQKQLLDASHRLHEAETKANSDVDRSKIATAQQILRTAQSELAAESTPSKVMIRIDADAQFESEDRAKVQLKGLDTQLTRIKLDGQKPRMDVKLRALQVQPHVELEQSPLMIAKLESPVLVVALQESEKPRKVPASVMAGNTLTKVTPVYPASAKEAKIQGEVVLHAIIDENGKVEQVAVVSSPDNALSKSSIDAVRQWMYKPYLLNGKPTAVDTTINVNFTLAP
ncbi:M56 family metallopeptidase [Terriglobus sp. RCC_193]|uniref:M56 family metallopeptidase n=1 Tax=Terriglobus sp. RCC_193 TaxID=3239218 RepID=UPI0035260A90